MHHPPKVRPAVLPACTALLWLRHVLGCPDQKAVGCHCTVGRRRSFTTACCCVQQSFDPSSACQFLSVSIVCWCVCVPTSYLCLPSSSALVSPTCIISCSAILLALVDRTLSHCLHPSSSSPPTPCSLVSSTCDSLMHPFVWDTCASSPTRGLFLYPGPPNPSITPFASLTTPSITTSIHPLHASFPFPYIGLFRFLACGELTVGSNSPANAVITPNPARAIAP
ncbi:hypothetical protein CC79DRAFT_639138 [Sarocladium strictum]